MTASIVVEASSSPEMFGGREKRSDDEEEKKHNFSTSWNEEEKSRESDTKEGRQPRRRRFRDRFNVRRRTLGRKKEGGKEQGKASNTTRSRSGTISKIFISFFFCICLLLGVFCFCFSLFLNSKIFKIVRLVFEYTQTTNEKSLFENTHICVTFSFPQHR